MSLRRHSEILLFDEVSYSCKRPLATGCCKNHAMCEFVRVNSYSIWKRIPFVDSRNCQCQSKKTTILFLFLYTYIYIHIYFLDKEKVYCPQWELFQFDTLFFSICDSSRMGPLINYDRRFVYANRDIYPRFILVGRTVGKDPSLRDDKTASEIQRRTAFGSSCLFHVSPLLRPL